MSPFLVVISTWLHALATIVMVGYFVFTSLIYLPILEREMPASVLRGLLQKFSARLKPYFGSALLIFLVTGTHLMVINEQYLGLGNIFANAWSILIVAKHVLVVGFLAVAFISERVYMSQISDQNPIALQQYRRALASDLALGLLILLLTALAQVG